MILSDTTIVKMIKKGEILIQPDFNLDNVRPTGVRVHLGDEILLPNPRQIIDLEGKSEVKYRRNTIDPLKGYQLKPGAFILGTTLENFLVPRDIVCHIDGRSTPARLGLTIHCTSSIVDGNYEEARAVTLEIKNNGPFTIVLKPKNAIGMLTFTKLSEPIKQKTQKQYAGQKGVVPPNLKNQKTN